MSAPGKFYPAEDPKPLRTYGPFDNNHKLHRHTDATTGTPAGRAQAIHVISSAIRLHGPDDARTIASMLFGPILSKTK